jgi:hypothetical protein
MYIISVEKFSHEMDTLLEITLRSTLVEKLSMALYDCLFELEDLADEQQEGKVAPYTALGLSHRNVCIYVCMNVTKDGELSSSLDEYDHIAVASVHAFLQVDTHPHTYILHTAHTYICT